MRTEVVDEVCVASVSNGRVVIEAYNNDCRRHIDRNVRGQWNLDSQLRVLSLNNSRLTPSLAARPTVEEGSR